MDLLITTLEGIERMCMEEYESRRNSFVWAKTADEYKHKAAGVRCALEIARGMR